ncbi:SAM-dependent methyltransferase [Kribbella sp. NPDC020789]
MTEVTRSNLVGGEMLNWSDLHPADSRPAAGGAAAVTLLAGALRPGDSVLVAGPHAAGLYADVVAQAESVDILVRSAPDAEELAETLGTAKTQVYCGSFDRFETEETYDLIVALDGLERLVGPDTESLPWSEALGKLVDRLAPDGRLLLGATNSFSVNRMIQTDITAALPRDEDWGRAVGDAAPAGLAPLEAALRAAGLKVKEGRGAPGLGAQVFGVYPSLVTAEVLVGDDEQLTAAAAARVVAGCNSGPTLMDPYRVVMDAGRAGLLVGLAPGWFVVVGDVEVAAAAPAGELVEERLLAALRADDQLALRREVVRWLENAPAAADNVIVDGTSYRLLEPAGALTVEAALERFVERALKSGVRLPWPAGGSGEELTARLASMVGVTLAPSSNREVVRPLGSAEQLATVARLADELAHASARAILFEGTVSGIRRSVPYRLGHAMLNPARVVRRRLKRLLRRR